jgi:multicomponent Na+:H+ antiporter subunit B
VTGEHRSENVRIVAALALPFILVFGVYVITHGHYGPGGGFAGGVVLAVGVVLARITLDHDANRRCFRESLALVAMILGGVLFLASAWAPVLAGGELLDYAQVEVGDLAASRLRYYGIFIVEVAVGAVVFGGIVLIFDRLVSMERR